MTREINYNSRFQKLPSTRRNAKDQESPDQQRTVDVLVYFRKTIIQTNKLLLWQTKTRILVTGRILVEIAETEFSQEKSLVEIFTLNMWTQAT